MLSFRHSVRQDSRRFLKNAVKYSPASPRQSQLPVSWETPPAVAGPRTSRLVALCTVQAPSEAKKPHFRRVVEIDSASAKLLADLCVVRAQEGKHTYFTGIEDNYGFRRYLVTRITGMDTTELLRLSDTDRALGGCEDALIREQGRGTDEEAEVPLEGQYL
jgi:hypothetical protein